VYGTYASKIGRFGAIATAATCLGYAELVKAAGVDWSIQASEPVLFDYNHDGINDAISITYIVTNTSDPGDANNMTSFGISAGSNQGINENMIAELFSDYMPGWYVSVGQNETIFTGNYIAPSGSQNFYLYGNVPQITTGTATAMSEAHGSFTSQVIITPVPEPLGIGLIMLGLAAIGLKRTLTSPS